MPQEGRDSHRTCVAPAASPDGNRAVLPFTVPGDEHVGNLGPLCLPDLQADLLAAQVRFNTNPGLGQAARHVLSIACVLVRDRDHDGLHRRQPRGEAPAYCSIRMPKNRSIDPISARWIMIGRWGWPSSPMNSSPKRSGLLKSTWTVEHCQDRPSTSLILMSILGP